MKSFTVQFHKEDQVDEMVVRKLNEDDFHTATEGGTRHLFELDTNIGFFVYFDAVDLAGNESYLVLHYEGVEGEDEEEEPSGCYAFELKDFYQFAALQLNDLEFHEELGDDEEDEEYGPIHHLAHLMYHIVEEGKKISA